jgi:PleD family two-component response regulator
MTLQEAAEVGETLRAVVARAPFDLSEYGVDVELPITISVGVAAVEAGAAESLKSCEQLTHAADQGVYAAKAAGRNRVCTHEIAAAVIKPPQTKTVMIVEDDPLASRLLSFLFSKCRELKPIAVRSAEEAIEWVSSPSATRPMPDAVLCDLNLPGMSGLRLLESLRARHLAVPFLMVASSSDQADRDAAIAAGADGFIDKAEFCTNPDQWLSRVVNLVQHAKIAA